MYFKQRYYNIDEGRVSRWIGRKFDNWARGTPMTPEEQQEYEEMKHRSTEISKDKIAPAYQAARIAAGKAKQAGNRIDRYASETELADSMDKLNAGSREIRRLRRPFVGKRRPRSEWGWLGRRTNGWVQGPFSKSTKINEAVKPQDDVHKYYKRQISNLKRAHTKERKRWEEERKAHEMRRKLIDDLRQKQQDRDSSYGSSDNPGSGALGFGAGMALGSMFK